MGTPLLRSDPIARGVACSFDSSLILSIYGFGHLV